jgi:hypothetical protein
MIKRINTNKCEGCIHSWLETITQKDWLNLYEFADNRLKRFRENGAKYVPHIAPEDIVQQAILVAYTTPIDAVDLQRNGDEDAYALRNWIAQIIEMLVRRLISGPHFVEYDVIRTD